MVYTNAVIGFTIHDLSVQGRKGLYEGHASFSLLYALHTIIRTINKLFKGQFHSKYQNLKMSSMIFQNIKTPSHCCYFPGYYFYTRLRVVYCTLIKFLKGRREICNFAGAYFNFVIML